MSRRTVIIAPAGVFTMAVAAELSGLHPQTLRSYERHGLLTPTRTDGGTRRYSEADVRLARRVAELTLLGVSMAGIALVLALEAENEKLRVENGRLRSSAVGEPENRGRRARRRG